MWQAPRWPVSLLPPAPFTATTAIALRLRERAEEHSSFTAPVGMVSVPGDFPVVASAVDGAFVFVQPHPESSELSQHCFAGWVKVKYLVIAPGGSPCKRRRLSPNPQPEPVRQEEALDDGEDPQSHP